MLNINGDGHPAKNYPPEPNKGYVSFKKLLDGVTLQNLLIYLDYDDCLQASTERSLTTAQIKILRRLNELTNGGVIITTNSDGRSVEAILPDFPIISEFSTVFRNISPWAKSLYFATKPDCKAAFNAATQFAEDNKIRLTEKASDLQTGAKPSIKAEEKEMGLAFVFGQHANMRTHAIAMAKAAFKAGQFNEDEFEIDYTGKDAIEIKVKDAAKADAPNYADLFDHLKDRTVQIAIGDSGSDLAVMKKTGRGVVIGNSITDGSLSGVAYMRIQTHNDNYDNTWIFLGKLVNHLERLKQQATETDPSQSNHNPKHPAPRAR